MGGVNIIIVRGTLVYNPEDMIICNQIKMIWMMPVFLSRWSFFPTYLQLDVVQSERFLPQLEHVSYVRKAVKRQSRQSLQCKPEKQRDADEVAHEDQVPGDVAPSCLCTLAQAGGRCWKR